MPVEVQTVSAVKVISRALNPPLKAVTHKPTKRLVEKLLITLKDLWKVPV
jgi:hypothetical protein